MEYGDTLTVGVRNVNLTFPTRHPLWSLWTSVLCFPDSTYENILHPKFDHREFNTYQCWALRELRAHKRIRLCLRDIYYVYHSYTRLCTD